MGNTWEIQVFDSREGDFSYIMYWQGESVFAAVWNMRKARKDGYKCIKLEWRP